MHPLGLSSSDALELLLAVALAAVPFLWQPQLASLCTRVAGNTRLCIIGLAALPLLLRFALLAAHPVPLPANYDEFSHLLVADTLLHGRLANPAHPMARFFETSLGWNPDNPLTGNHASITKIEAQNYARP